MHDRVAFFSGFEFQAKSHTSQKINLEISFKLPIKCRSMAFCTKLCTEIVDKCIIRVSNREYMEICIYTLLHLEALESYMV